jgi:hypothetical protein
LACEGAEILFGDIAKQDLRAARCATRSRQRPPAGGLEPDPASFGPVLFVVPERLIEPVDGPLPAAPGVEPDPASLGPVLFAVPDRLVALPAFSAAVAGIAAARRAAMARLVTFMADLPLGPAIALAEP